MKQFEDFITDCLKGFCNRRTIYNSKTCKTINKHKVCYKWEELKQYIKERDITCLVSKILTPEEVSIVEKQDGYWLNNKYLDGAHIIPRSTCPAQIYNKDNVVLIGRFFHTRLDNYTDLLTGDFIGQQGMALWWTRIMRQNKRWSENYTYWDFKRDLFNL